MFRVAYLECHLWHFDARGQLDARCSYKFSVELDAPARPWVLLVRKKFLDGAIAFPTRSCGIILGRHRRAFERTTKGAEDPHLLSKRDDFL